MGKIYITRHGETELNIQFRYQGFIDSPLTQRGIMQAEALGSVLYDKKIERVYSSDLGRAVATAKIIMAGRDYEFFEEYDLREQNWGDWDGRVHEEVWASKGFSGGYEFHEKYPDPENGESQEVFRARIIPCFERIAAENKNRDILIVTSYGDVNAIVGYLQAGRTKAHINQASLTIVSNEDTGLKLELVNDVSHLLELGIEDN